MKINIVKNYHKVSGVSKFSFLYLDLNGNSIKI